MAGPATGAPATRTGATAPLSAGTPADGGRSAVFDAAASLATVSTWTVGARSLAALIGGSGTPATPGAGAETAGAPATGAATRYLPDSTGVDA
ncbi:MAG: hypothetical protein ACYDCQ_19640 [Dehalococcoidia bacterium]